MIWYYIGIKISIEIFFIEISSRSSSEIKLGQLGFFELEQLQYSRDSLTCWRSGYDVRLVIEAITLSRNHFGQVHTHTHAFVAEQRNSVRVGHKQNWPGARAEPAKKKKMELAWTQAEMNRC